MNKNSFIGMALIAAILITFFIISMPSAEEKMAMQKHQDSIVKVEQEKINKQKQDSVVLASKKDSVVSIKKDTVKPNSDSLAIDQAKDNYGMFAGSSTGSKKLITIENEFAKFKFSNQGGRIYYVQLKDYRTYDSLPLVLFDGDSTIFNFKFYYKNRTLNTSDFYFEPLIADSRFIGKDSITIKGNDSIVFAMRLYPDSAFNAKKDKYIELQYTIYGNDYMMKSQLKFVGLQEVVNDNLSGVNLHWSMNLRQQEKSLKNERIASTIYYKYFEDDVNYLTETKSAQEKLTTKVSWIGFKQQFFTSVLIANNGFSSGDIYTVMDDSIKTHVKSCDAQMLVGLDAENKSFSMRMYFGPTHYKTLRKYHMDLERQIPLGWSSPYILGWINRFAVIPVFNWLQSTGMSYGIIILILTILLKIVLLPIAYKTYLSSAKMRVLKPEIDEINAKIPKEKTLERQQATMALYKKAGVNPLAGCVPLLLQMPILIALYRFFPASIELRQQGFLWATDLSSYDSIWDFGFTIPFYGDHMSLFTILMTISTLIYTHVNNKLMGSQQQMPGMKFMMYFMPIMFLGFFNDFAAGLSYYYFLANMLTFLQMWIIRKFVDEDAIHRKIQENKKKPDTKKKSAFQKRLEEMAKQKGYNMPKR